LRALGPIFFGFRTSPFGEYFDGQSASWVEYGAYVSPIVVLLALVAILRDLRRHWVWLGVLGFFLLLGLGHFAPWSPWALLSGLPGYDTARCTGRFFQFVVLAAAVLAGFGFDALRLWGRSQGGARWFAGLLGIAFVVVVATNLAIAWPVMASASSHPPPVVESSTSFAHVLNDKRQLYRNYLANRGSLSTPQLSLYHPSRYIPGPENDVLRELVTEGSARVVRADYTPNRIEYVLESPTSGNLVLGMGYDRGWRSADGRAVRNDQGFISVPFARGSDEISLYYRTPFFLPGLWISVIAWVTVIGVWFRTPTARRVN
jgi:hypothetical protein